MDLTALLDGLRQLNILDASLFGTALGLGVVLRLARAAWFHFGDAATGMVAIVLGVLGAVLTLTQTAHPWQFVALESILLGGVVSLVELALRSGADSGLPLLRLLPKDNEWVKDKEKP